MAQSRIIKMIENTLLKIFAGNYSPQSKADRAVNSHTADSQISQYKFCYYRADIFTGAKIKTIIFFPFLSFTIQWLLQVWRKFHSPSVQAPLCPIVINWAVMKLSFLQFTNWFLVCFLIPSQILQNWGTTSNIQWPSAPPSFFDNSNWFSSSCGIQAWWSMFTPSNASGETLLVREHQNEKTVPWQMKYGIKLLLLFMCRLKVLSMFQVLKFR